MKCTFYAEDANVCSPEEFFTILQKFHMMMDNAASMNRKERELEEKRILKDKQVQTLTRITIINVDY